MQDLLKQLQDPQKISELSRQTGISEEDIKKVAALGVPTLIQALNQNAEDQDQAQSLAQAFDDHQDDDPNDMSSFLDRFLGQGEGERMINHIFPNNRSKVEEGLAEKTGLQSDAVRRILSILAPLLLANMASKWSKKKKEEMEMKRQVEQNDTRVNIPGSFRDIPAGQEVREPGFNLPSMDKMDIPSPGRYWQEDVRDITRRAQEEAKDQSSGNVLFDIAKDILGSSQGSGGILDDLLGGFFGR